MSDQRETAATAIGIVRGMVDWFPAGSPGRRVLIRAARQLKLSYILGEPQKLGMVMAEIKAGNRRFTDILKATGLERIEIEHLLDRLVAAKYIRETLEKPLSVSGAGRPVRNYEILKNNSP